MSTISASTTTTTAYKVTADTTGTLVLQTGATPTTAVTIDGSQNVGIGVTPSAWSGMLPALQIGAYGSAVAAWGSNRNLYALSNAYYNSGFKYSTTATASAAYYDISGETGTHSWYTAGAAASHSAGDAVTFTQAMTLDSSGNLLVGTTSNPITGRMTLSYGGTVWTNGPAQSQPDRFHVVNSSSVGVYVVSGNTSWTATSDERYKDIIEPITNAASKVSSLRTVIGKYKTDEEGTRRSFLIAQDVQTVFPEAVDASDSEKLGIQYTELIPLLTAAIKEQQTIIQQLTARIETLEAK